MSAFMSVRFLFKFFCNVLQKTADGQVLGTDLLAPAALDAVGRPAAGGDVDDVIIVVRVPAVVDLLRVHGGEEVGDGDVLRTAVRAVAADGAGDEILAVKDLLHALDGGEFPLIQRPEVAHEGDVVLHLRKAAHAGEHHQHPGKARGEADGIARGAAAAEPVEHGARRPGGSRG